MSLGARYVRDADGRIVIHEHWPRDLWERGSVTLTVDFFEGSSSSGLREGDVVYYGEVAIWDESARRRERSELTGERERDSLAVPRFDAHPPL